MTSSITALVPVTYYQSPWPTLYFGVVYWHTNKNVDLPADYGKRYVGYTLDEPQRLIDWDNLSTDYAGTKINEARKRTPLELWEYTSEYHWDTDPDRLEETLKRLETYYIDYFDSYENGFNGNRGGRGIAAWVEFRVTDTSTGVLDIVQSYDAVAQKYGIPRGSIRRFTKKKGGHLTKNGVKIERIN